jgi:hypothetical protein
LCYSLRIVGVVAGLSALTVAATTRTRQPHTTPPAYLSESESALLIEYEKVGLIIERDCAIGTTSIDAGLWSAVPRNKQRVIVRMMAGWCAKQGYAYTMALIDQEGRRVLARWNGRESTITGPIAR